MYFEISRHADVLADRIRDTLAECGYPLFVEGSTNQIFVTLPNALLKALDSNFTYAVWEKQDEAHTTVRFCTSWATKPENVTALCDAIKNFR